RDAGQQLLDEHEKLLVYLSMHGRKPTSTGVSDSISAPDTRGARRRPGPPPETGSETPVPAPVPFSASPFESAAVEVTTRPGSSSPALTATKATGTRTAFTDDHSYTCREPGGKIRRRPLSGEPGSDRRRVPR